MEAVRNALSGAQAPVQELAIEPDLIVVGGGMAGIVASVRGAELGCRCCCWRAARASAAASTTQAARFPVRISKSSMKTGLKTIRRKRFMRMSCALAAVKAN